MKARSYLAYMRQESRGSVGRFAFFVACLAVGVAAIVAVAGLSEGLDQGIRGEARELLAADLAISSQRPLPEEVTSFFEGRPGLATATVKEMVTVVAAPGTSSRPGASQVVELKVVPEEYPFYGTVELDPTGSLGAALGAESAVAAPDLLARLGLEVGEVLKVGGQPFTVAAQVLDEPDRIGGAFTLGPRLFLSPAGLTRADLERFGSRIMRRTLIRLPGDSDRGDAEALADELRQLLPATGAFRVETYVEAQPMLRQGVRRAERFLGLAALLSLLIGGIGISQTVRAWLAGRLNAIAVLRCLGFRPREVFALYLGQTMLLGLVGSVLGAILGTLVLAGVPAVLGDLLPGVELKILQPTALARGIGMGLAVAILFAFGPLLAVGRIPPLRVLRRDVEPPRAGRWQRLSMTPLLVAGVFGAAAVQSESALLGLQFTGGLGVAALILAAVAFAGVKLIARLPLNGGPTWLRHGVRALARPGAATLAAVTALGLGTLFVVGMGLVERALTGELAGQIPEEAPTAFMIDIQPDQWAPVEKVLDGAGATAVDSVPVVTARLAAIDGRGVDELAEEAASGNDRWALTREQRLTYGAELPADNRIVEGALWSADGVDEVSVEQEFAENLGVGVGSVLRFDIQGTEVDLTVTSLRAVDWRTFGINFFLVVEPGVLESAPQVRLAVARLPELAEQPIQDELAADFPNVTLIRTREVLEKIGRILGRLAEAVRFLGVFTVIAGIVILAGAVSSSAVRRGREIALLKTLGSTRGQVIKMFLVENALLGLVAGVIGALGGAFLAQRVIERGFELEHSWDPAYLAGAVVLAVALTAATSIAAGWSALSRRPMDVLRSE